MSAAPDQSVNQAEYEQLAAFRGALRRFLRFSEEAAIAAGLPPQQHQALLAIKGFAGEGMATVGDLAERLQVAPHSAVGLVNRMVKEDLLARQPGERDRRQMRLRLTARGEEVLARLSAAHREELRRIAPEMQKLLAQLAGEDAGAARRETL